MSWGHRPLHEFIVNRMSGMQKSFDADVVVHDADDVARCRRLHRRPVVVRVGPKIKAIVIYGIFTLAYFIQRACSYRQIRSYLNTNLKRKRTLPKTLTLFRLVDYLVVQEQKFTGEKAISVKLSKLV